MKHLWVIFTCLLWLQCSPGEKTVTIKASGFPDLTPLIQTWQTEISQTHQNIVLDYETMDLQAGLKALLEGKTHLVFSNRPASADIWKKAGTMGLTLNQYVIGYDSLAVFVHQDHPIEEFSLNQMAGLFSETSPTWAALGIKSATCSSDQSISLGIAVSDDDFSRFAQFFLSSSGTVPANKQRVQEADWLTWFQQNPCGLGLGKWNKVPSDAVALCLTETPDSPCIQPTEKTLSNRSFPLSRPVYAYSLDRDHYANKTMLHWILGPRGQCLLKAHGYAPIRTAPCP